MSSITLEGEPLLLSGHFPAVGESAADFRLVFSRRPDAISGGSAIAALPRLRVVGLGDYQQRRKVLNIFPSIDTPVCAQSVKTFERHAMANPKDAMLMISADLPFAMQRFCADGSIRNVFALSMMADRAFAQDYGVLIASGPWTGICARACLVLDQNNTVLHAELVPRIEDEPNYNAALAALA